MVQFIQELYEKYEYEEVGSPNIYNFELWNTSGHAAHYKENMFVFQVEKQEYGLKPMNCPGETLCPGVLPGSETETMSCAHAFMHSLCADTHHTFQPGACCYYSWPHVVVMSDACFSASSPILSFVNEAGEGQGTACKREWLHCFLQDTA